MYCNVHITCTVIIIHDKSNTYVCLYRLVCFTSAKMYAALTSYVWLPPGKSSKTARWQRQRWQGWVIWWWDYFPSWENLVSGATVDGQNPAPVDMVNIPLFIGFYTSQVVQDFVHQQYGSFREGTVRSMFGEFAEQPTLNFIYGRPAKKAENKRLEGKNEGLVMFGSDDFPLHFGMISVSSH